MKKLLCLSFSIMVFVWGGYYLNFGVDGVISGKTDVWGQFGDYVGGVLNPILSFISIYLLINSLTLQRQANISLVNEVSRQERLEDYKKFEFRFFHLVDSLDKTFSMFKVCVGDVEEKGGGAPTVLKGGAAVTYLEDGLFILVSERTERTLIINWLDDIDEDDSLFSVVRRFYLIVKLINESDFDNEDFQEMLINLTDLKVITLVAIACSYYDWEIVKYINRSGILKRKGISEFVEQITSPTEK